MDYIKEINAFYDHDLVNQLSQSAGYLYLALLNMANRLFWKEGFVVSDVMLMARSGIKDRRTFKRVINELVSCKLILVKDDKNGSTYTICGLACHLPAKNAANLATKDAANDVARNAANNANMADIPAWNAALIAEIHADFTESHASIAAFDAGDDSSKARENGVSNPAQTKPNQLNKTETASANADTGQDHKNGATTDRKLIAELVRLYREVPGIIENQKDYSLVGSLYKEYGYEAVLYAINELLTAAAASQIQKPLPYLRAILKRAGPGSGPGPPIKFEQAREEDPLERYQRERYKG